MHGSCSDFRALRDAWFAKCRSIGTAPATAGEVIVKVVRAEGWPTDPDQTIEQGLLCWTLWVKGDDDTRRAVGYHDLDIFIITRDLAPDTFAAAVRVERRRIH